MSPKEFFSARTWTLPGFVELNKPSRIFLNERFLRLNPQKVPKKSLKRPFKALGKGETDDVFPIFRLEASNLAHGGFSFLNQRLPVPKRGIPTPFQSVCGSILSSKRVENL